MHHEIIHIDDEPSLCKVISKDMVHECLEGRWGVALAEEHYCRFIEPIRSSESSFSLVNLINLNIVIPPLNVQFDEVPEVFQHVDKVKDTREGVSILDSMGVDIIVVLTGTKHAILLQNKEEREHLWKLGGDDLILLQVLINECFQGLHFLRVE